MNRVLLLILVALAAFLVIFFASKPELIEEIWIWLIGLIGAIAGVIKVFAEKIKGFFKNKDENIAIPDSDKYNGSSLKILRISDDGESTIGNLFVNDKFYCYTLEDSKQDMQSGNKRIPEGVYTMNYGKNNTPSTSVYRESFQEWFTHHIEVQNVPDYSSVHIHCGEQNTSTGSIILTENINNNRQDSQIDNSKEAFKRLYLFLSGQFENKIPVRLIIKDENWITKLNSN